jgi:hypothetical protein
LLEVNLDEHAPELGTSSSAFATGDYMFAQVQVARPEEIGSFAVVELAGSGARARLKVNPKSKLLEGVLQVPGYYSQLDGGKPGVIIELSQANEKFDYFVGGRNFPAPSFTGPFKIHDKPPKITNVKPTRIDAHTLEVAYDVSDESGLSFTYVQVLSEYTAKLGLEAGRRYHATQPAKRALCESAARKDCHIVIRVENLPEVMAETPTLEVEAVNEVGHRANLSSTPIPGFRPKSDFAFSWPTRPVTDADMSAPRAGALEFVSQEGRTVHVRFTFFGGKFTKGYVNIDIHDKSEKYPRQMGLESKFTANPATGVVDATFELPEKLYSRDVKFLMSATAENGNSASPYLLRDVIARIRTDVIKLDTLPVQFVSAKFRKPTAEELKAYVPSWVPTPK